MDGLTEGCIVHYVMENGEHRPAIIVNNWDGKLSCPCEGYVNLIVFTDGSNDITAMANDAEEEDVKHGTVWITSVCYKEDKQPHTWHWIEKA